jgi:hypothetical protein
VSFKRLLAVSVGGALFIAIIIALSSLLSIFTGGQREFALPDAREHTPREAEDGGNDPRDGIERVLVTVDNVQEVIKTLRRPESYSRDIMIESFWQGGNTVYNISVAVMDGATSLRSVSGSVAKNIIVTDDRLHIWYGGDTSVYVGERGSGADTKRAADEYQMLITYEDILLLDKSALTGAGYDEYGGTRCIFAEYRSGAFGYSTRCYISPELGLIVGAEQYDGQALIYKMTTGQCNIGQQDEQAFKLPDGTVVK